MAIPFLFLGGCKQKQDAPETAAPVQNVSAIDALLGAKLNASNFVKVQGHFLTMDGEEYAVLRDAKNGRDVGIIISICSVKQGTVTINYETPIVDGAVKHSIFQKVNVPGVTDTLLYYDSGDFFMGSGSGELYAYIIQPKEVSFLKAHLFIDGDTPPKVFIPDTPKTKVLRGYLFNKLRDQFPGLKFAAKDVSID